MRVIRWLILVLISLAPARAQTTVPPSFFGLNLTNTAPLSPALKVFAAAVRLPALVWSSIETCKPTNPLSQNDPCYNWVTFDANLASVAPGRQVIFVFNGVPGWANGNAGSAVPPTTFQDFYNFVTVTVQRSANRITYWEPWNEADASTFWAGTQAQMLTLVQNVYSIVHANCACLVLTPSTAVYWGIPWLQAWFSMGAGAYADIVNIHCYPAYFNSGGNPTPTRPEQVSNEVRFIAQNLSYYGVSYPVVCDEGGSSGSLISAIPAANLGPYTSVWLTLLASGGIPSYWFTYDFYSDADGAWGTLTDQANWLTSQGQAYRVTQSWLSGATFTSPVARTPGTNLLRNPSAAGASTVAAGACPSGTNTGTPPTDWAVLNPDTAHGVSTEVVGTGTDGGIPYVDFRICGTPTSGAAGYVELALEASNHIAGTQGSFFTLGSSVKLQAGSLTNISNVQLNAAEYSAGNSYLDTILFFNLFPLPAALSLQYNEYSFALSNANAAFVQPTLTIADTVGEAFDVTLRVGRPDVDGGSIWSGSITRANGNAAQIVWDASGGPSSFSTSYTDSWTLDGNHTPVSGTVTLTNSPRLLESAVEGGWTP